MLARRIAAKARQALLNAKDFVIGKTALGVIGLLRLFPADGAIAFAGRFARRFGPLFGRHRVALDNLRQAYPEKSMQEIEAIALDMWENMGRLAAEYIYLDDLFDFDRTSESGERIEVDGKEVFLRIAGEDRPHIVFTGHIGNFELLPVAGAALGVKVTALFRPPNNPYIADFIHHRRNASMGDLLASRQGAAFALSRILERGGNIGVLVDQKFTNGVRTRFFGRECETSPLLPKLVRHFECDVYPARCIRLPGNRYRLMIEDRLAIPRTVEGAVDVPATAQLLNDVVERWVRENPGQWMWFHKRWKLSDKPRRHRHQAARSP
ncbi:MAG: lipid A biosynthesis lauroyl acyltransferase [Rhizobiaceae bacterium]|nr:lipid A biosynthesis lauroyl acyltransferase [Rhizobiaceae bacterium]